MNSADHLRLPGDVASSAYGQRLSGATASWATGAGQGPGLVLRPHQKPADDRDVVDRQTTRATSSDDMVRRYMLLESSRDLRALVKAFIWTFAGVAAVATLSVLYVGLFLVLLHYAPHLTVEQDMRVVWAAFGGGAGLGLVGQIVKTRLRRRGHGSRPPV